MDGKDEEQKIREERGKLKAEWRFIKNFFRAERFSEKILSEVRKGRELMECKECGGLRGSKTWDKIR